jgi:hypothetical protein
MHTLIKLNQLTANANDTIEKLHLLTERILIAFSSAIFLGIIILFISNQINKKRTKEFICKVSEIDDKMESSLNNLMIKTSSLLNVINADVLENDKVRNKGIEFFQTAKEIHYIGAGGFSAQNAQWRKELNSFISKEDTKLIRIVDLPTNPKKYFKDEEVINYFTWLILRAVILDCYSEKVYLYNSRHAPLWKTGFVVMIKDDQEMLVFTGGVTKSGNIATKNIEKFITTIEFMKIEPLTLEDILNNYFRYYDLDDNTQRLIARTMSGNKPNIENPTENFIKKNIREFFKYYNEHIEN